MRFEILTFLVMNVEDWWDIMPYCLIYEYQYFKEADYVHL